MIEQFRDTSTTVAAAAGVQPDTVRTYADLGLLEFVRLSNGMRLFPPDSAKRVREIYSSRMARRGRSRD